MFDFLILYFGYLKNSKKILLVSIIGLTCALGLVSSSVNYIDNSKSEISNKIINSTTNSTFDVSLSYNTNFPYINTNSYTNTVNEFTTNISNTLNVNIFSNLELTYSALGFYTTQQSPPVNHNYLLINNSVIIVELNSALKHDLQSFLSTNSTLPVSNKPIQQAFALQSDSLKSTNSGIDFYKNNNLINKSLMKVFLGYNLGNGTQTFFFNVTGVGKLINTLTFNTQTNTYTLNDQLNQYPTLKNLILNNQPIETFLFVNNLTRFLYSINLDKYNLPYVTADGGYKIDFNKINVLLLSSKLSDISLFSLSLQNRIINSNYFAYHEFYNPRIKVIFQTQQTYEIIGQTTNTILYFVFLYSFPVLTIALFMISYSFGLIYRGQMNLIGIYRTRGFSKYFILVFACFDLFIIALISAVISIALGIPISILAFKSDYLLSFNNPLPNYLIGDFLTNLSSILFLLTICSIIFSIIVNFFKILHLATISIEETQNPREKTDPIWKKFYLDILIFIYGLVSYEVMNYLTSNPNFSQQTNAVVYTFLTLTIPSPFFIVLGLLLIVNRIIPIFLNWIGTKLWKLRGNLTAFSFKDLVKYTQTSSKAIILIASLISFIFIFYTVPYSQVNYAQQLSLFENGADGVLQINSFASNLTSIRDTISNISSELNTQYNNSLLAFSPYFTVIMYDTGVSNEQLIFINSSTYVQASSISQIPTGLKKNLSNDLASLRKVNNSILINKVASITRGISINDKVYFSLTDLQSQEFSVVDIYKEWPATTRYSWDRNLYAIVDMNAYINAPVNTYANTSLSKISNLGFYLNFRNGANRTLVAQQLSKQFGATIKLSLYSIKDWNVEDGLIIQFQIGQININTIITLLIIVLILIMFSYMQLFEKRQELQTLRSLGLNLLQTNYLFLFELAILIFFGLILGSFIGGIFLQLLTVFMTQGSDFPPYQIITPWNLIIETLLGIILLTILESFIASYLIIKKEIHQTLF